MKFSTRNLLPLAVMLTMLTAISCSTSPRPTVEQSSDRASPSEQLIEELLAQASRRSGVEAADLSIRAMEEMLNADLPERAFDLAQQTGRLNFLPAELQLRLALVQTEIALLQGQPEVALRWLTGSISNQLVSVFESSPPLRETYYLKLGVAYSDNRQYADAVIAYLQLSDRPQADSISAHDRIWDTINKLDDEQLGDFADAANSYESRGWIELTRVVRSNQFSIKSQLDSMTRWNRTWNRHSAANQLPTALVDLQQVWEQRPKHIALILPLKTPTGNAIQEGFISAYYQALAVSREVPRLSVYDSSDISLIQPVYDEAVASGADLIIGPFDKALVNQLQRQRQLPVPTLALNYADDPLPSTENLFQFGLSPEDEIEQAASLAWNAGHKNAAIITPQSDAYLRWQTMFADIWSAKGGAVVSQSTFGGERAYSDVIKSLMAIDSSESRAERLLNLLPRNNMQFTPRRRNDIDFIFLIANPIQGRQIKPTLAFYYAENVPVYSLPSIYNGLDNQSADQDLNDIIFTDAPWVLNSSDPLKSEMDLSLRPAQGLLLRLRAMGVDSFRLYARLQQLADRQLESLQGVTGELSMEEGGRIHRSLNVVRFVNGIATASNIEG